MTKKSFAVYQILGIEGLRSVESPQPGKLRVSPSKLKKLIDRAENLNRKDGARDRLFYTINAPNTLLIAGLDMYVSKVLSEARIDDEFRVPSYVEANILKDSLVEAVKKEYQK